MGKSSARLFKADAVRAEKIWATISGTPFCTGGCLGATFYIVSYLSGPPGQPTQVPAPQQSWQATAGESTLSTGFPEQKCCKPEGNIVTGEKVAAGIKVYSPRVKLSQCQNISILIARYCSWLQTQRAAFR